MPRLYPVVPLNPDETLTSYVSRLAVLNCAPSAADFCSDLGYSFLKLCYGREQGIAWLSDLTGEPETALRRAALIQIDDGWFLRSEKFYWTALRRTSLAFCPACLRTDGVEDRHSGSHAYERIAWSLEAVRSCPHHGMALQIIKAPTGIQNFRDFARCTAQAFDTLDQTLADVERRPATELEIYILRRLENGAGGETVFDTMPLSSAINVCEAFGTADLFGPSGACHLLTPNEKSAAGEAGFLKLRRGREGTVEILDGVRRKHLDSASALGRPSTTYGNLYNWLYKAKDDVYASFKSEAIEYILNHATSNLRKSLFGQPIPERPWYSIRTAHNAFGIDPKRLRNVMAASGLIAADASDLRDSQVIVSAADLQVLIREVEECVGWDGLTKLLGVPRRTVAQFVGQGLIEPMVPRGNQLLKSDLFRRSDIQHFIDRMLHGAVIVDSVQPTMYGLLSTRRRTLSRTGDIIELVLNRRLRWIGKRADSEGIPALLLDIDEVRSLIDPEKQNVTTFKKAAAMLHIQPHAVHQLIERNFIEAEYAGHVKRRCVARLIPLASIAQFKKRYITRYELSRVTGIGYARLQCLADEYGLEPVGPPDVLKVHLYHFLDTKAFCKYLRKHKKI